MGLSIVGSHVAFTTSQIWTAKSSSVAENVSGEYSKDQMVGESGLSFVNSRTSFVHRLASSIVSSFVLLKTTLRKQGLVALYKCKMAFLAPLTDSTVRRISSSLHGVST